MKRSFSSNFSDSITNEFELIELIIIDFTLLYQNILIEFNMLNNIKDI